MSIIMSIFPVKPGFFCFYFYRSKSLLNRGLRLHSHLEMSTASKLGYWVLFILTLTWFLPHWLLFLSLYPHLDLSGFPAIGIPCFQFLGPLSSGLPSHLPRARGPCNWLSQQNVLKCRGTNHLIFSRPAPETKHKYFRTVMTCEKCSTYPKPMASIL